MEPAGLAALVLGCPMLQPGVMDDFFHSVIFGSLRADPNSVALLATKPCSHCRRTARETLASAPWDHVCSDANPRVRFALPAPVCQ